ncbi:MAG: Gfo/Idh/MocA family protein [Solirubrobacterales bacterium]
MRELGVGVVGCGFVSDEYLATLGVAEGLRVLACADLDAERALRASSRSGGKVLDAEAILAHPEIECVLNLTPPRSHCEVTLAALEAGKHVYSEKPLGIDRDEGARILALAERADARLGIAPDTFLGSSVQAARRAVDAGRIGEPVGGTAVFACRGHESWHPRPQFYYEEGGGPWLDMGPYHLTALVSLLGPVRAVAGAAATARPSRTPSTGPNAGAELLSEVPTHLGCTLEFENGAIVSCIFSFDACPAAMPALHLMGSEGNLALADPARFDSPVYVASTAGPAWEPLPPVSSPARGRGAGLVEMEAAIRSGVGHRASERLGFHVLDVLHSIGEAVAAGQRVEVGSSCERPRPYEDGEEAPAERPGLDREASLHIAAVEAEQDRDLTRLHLAANETWMSETARGLARDRMAERYVTGAGDESGVVTFGGFTFVGFPGIAELFEEAEAAFRRRLGAAAVNMFPVSGLHAMACTIFSVTEPGDVVLCVDPQQGGHFATSGVIARSGRIPHFIPYDATRLAFDPGLVAEEMRQSGAAAFYVDVSSNVSPHNLSAVRDAVGPDAVLVYDASHVLGLAMGGVYQDPLREGADVISANTHKTFPGPQKGLVAFRDAETAERANEVINGCMISSTHTGSMLALAVTALEMDRFGPEYATAMVANSNALGASLEEAGFEVRRTPSGLASENHQVHVFCDSFGEPREVAASLGRAGISANVDAALGPRPYIRIGTQEVTRRGMGADEMGEIASFLGRALIAGEEAAVAAEVSALSQRFKRAHYSFDEGELAVFPPSER